MSSLRVFWKFQAVTVELVDASKESAEMPVELGYLSDELSWMNLRNQADY